MTSRPVRATIVAVTFVLLVACGQQEATSSSSGAGASSSVSESPWILDGWSYKGPIDAALTYKDTSVNLAIPEATQVPLVDWFTAVNKCASGEAICDTVKLGFVALAVASSSSVGTVNDDKSVTPLMAKRLVYVLRQQGVECLPVGPAGAPSPTASVCDLTNFIDANTGEVLYSTRVQQG